MEAMDGNDIRDMLLNVTGLPLLIGDRVYSDKFVDNQTGVFIELTLIAAASEATHSAGGVVGDLWQIMIRGEKLSEVSAVYNLLQKQYNNGWSGKHKTWTVFAKTFLRKGQFEQDTRLFRRHIDLEVKYAEA